MSKSGILILAAIFLVLIGVFFFIRSERLNAADASADFPVSDSIVHIFKDFQGPAEPTIVAAPTAMSWRQFSTDNPSALAILLTDTSSDWIGLVHGLKNIGVPFVLTTNVKEAIKHTTVMAYPKISGQVLSAGELKQLAAVPRNGGTLLGINVYGGGLNEVFGFDTLLASTSRNALTVLRPLAGATAMLVHERERAFRLTNKADYPDAIITNGYTGAKMPLINFEDGTAFLAYKDYGAGKAFAFSMDLGNYFLRYMNERGFNAYRKYANLYDPGMDIILRVIKEIYQHSSPAAIAIGTVPFNKAVSLLITHDIDYTRSMANAVKYAELEDSMGIKATYFIQTKYIKDWNDAIFFNSENLPYLKAVKAKGMEIGSHSVAHSRSFSQLPQGTGKEQYPDYRPFVQDQQKVYNASVLGELRVSKFLLENLLQGVKVRSFRPGHLAHPFALPQSLEATGYLYSSSVTANNVQTHLPYIAMYNREFKSETGVVEIPITVEDELGVPLLERYHSTLQLVNQLAAYGGVVNVLIHTDTLGQKLDYERKLISALKPKAWISTISEFGKWWKLRNNVSVAVYTRNHLYEVVVSNPSDERIDGLTLQIPKGRVLAENKAGLTQQGNAVIISSIEGRSAVKVLYR